MLVNNAGILRDAFIGSMTEDQWDLVLAVHLKGHFATLRHAVDHWKARSKAGEEVNAAVINTASASGTFMPNPGQANYGSAKAAIAALTLVAAAELGRYGVRVNAIAPVARTRLTVDVPGPIGEMMKAPEDPDQFDPFHPRHVSPLVAFLAREDCTADRQDVRRPRRRHQPAHRLDGGRRDHHRRRLDPRSARRPPRRGGAGRGAVSRGDPHALSPRVSNVDG